MNIFGMNIAVIGAHLLAIPTDPARCVQREAQAQVLQNIIYSYIQKKYEILVMGDMNDYDMETLDMNSNKPTSRVLDIIKGIEGEKKGMYSLANVANWMKQQDRYSDWWDSDNNCNTASQNDYSMIDHVLVSYSLQDCIKDVFIYHNYSEYCGKMDSDHYPVVIDFFL
jgi:exonuclease III